MCMPKDIRFDEKTRLEVGAAASPAFIGHIKSKLAHYVNWTNSNMEECPLKCTEHANQQKGSPGCCEFRESDKTCAWTSETSYLAEEYRDEHGKESDTKAVICSKGSYFRLVSLSCLIFT